MVTLVTRLPCTRGDIYRPTTHTIYISKSLVHYMYTQRVCITSGIAMGGGGGEGVEYVQISWVAVYGDRFH